MAVGVRDILLPTIAVRVSLKKRRRSEDELSDLTSEQPLPKLHKSDDLKVDIEMSTSGKLNARYFIWSKTIQIRRYLCLDRLILENKAPSD